MTFAERFAEQLAGALIKLEACIVDREQIRHHDDCEFETMSYEEADGFVEEATGELVTVIATSMRELVETQKRTTI